MADRTTIRGTLVVVAALAAVVLIGLGAGRGGTSAGIPTTIIAPPATEIISFDQGIGRLDTMTGAIYRLRGNLSNQSATATWQMRVRPVTGQTSGILEIQKATFNDPQATFLVDKVTGQTWILRRRASETGSWEPVRIMQ